MKFEPFHNFVACDRLERVIRKLADAGTVPTKLEESYNRYHFSLVHKLRSAHWHVTTLDSYLAQADPTTDVEDVSYRANFHFDGFCYCAGSAKDIFAKEVLSYFGLPLPARVYFNTAREVLETNRAGDAVLPFLADPTWRADFLEYRNAATHECVVSTSITVHYELSGSSPTQRLEIPLPADPRNPGAGAVGHPDLVEYCRTTFKRTVSLFNQAYAHLAPRIAGHNSLPL